MTDDVRRCEACEAPMVPHARWHRGDRPEGHVAYGGRGLCRNHYQRLMRNGDLEPRTPGRPPQGRRDAKAARTRAEVLEDYAMIRDSVSTIAEAAERMGMTFSALDAALYRARKDGLEGALPPKPQLERGIHYGPARHLVGLAA